MRNIQFKVKYFTAVFVTYIRVLLTESILLNTRAKVHVDL